VRWALIQGVAILAIITWRWLPIFGFTSKLQDRQLLLVMTVLFFAFVAFLMLDLLVRISRQTDQIKRLTQELAIQRLRIDGIVPSQVQSSQSSIGDASPLKAPRKRRGSRPIEVLACIWIVACVSFFYLEAAQYNSRFYPDCLRKLLTADYQG
jgi:HAMP domain-containing protein